jgi:DNA modification methylase
MFCDFRYFTELSQTASSIGWTVWSTPLIWHKPTGGMLGDSTHGPRKSYECVLFAYKGDKRTTGLFLDVIIANPTSTISHAAAKPTEVYVNLARRSFVPGSQVLDPCAGSGPLLPAANELHLRATLIEALPQHVATCKTRLNEHLP